MDWGLSILSLENMSFAYYWRGKKAVLVEFAPNEDFLGDLEDRLTKVTGGMSLKDIRQLFQGEGMVRLSTSYLLEILKNAKGQKIGVLLSRDGKNALTKEEEKYLPLTEDNIAFVSESVNVRGEVDKALNDEEVNTAYKDLLNVGIHSLVVSLKNSWMFPIHERRIRDLLTNSYPPRFLGGVPTYLSSDFDPEYGERGLKNLTLINAYVQPVMRKYLFDLEQRLKGLGYRGGLFLGNRFGGLSRWDKIRAIDTASPDIGTTLAGGEVLCGQMRVKDVLVLKIDSYSSTLGIIKDGNISLNDTARLLGVMINAPCAEGITIPVGIKNSIKIDSGKITFDRDEKSVLNLETVDAILGYSSLDADSALINEFQKKIAGPLHKDLQEAALAVKEAFVSLLAKAVSIYLSSKKMDLAKFTLLPAEGRAGSCCWKVAKALGVPKVIISPCSEYLSAFGLASMGLRHFYQMSCHIALKSDFSLKDPDKFIELVQEGVRRIKLDVISEGYQEKGLGIGLTMVSRVKGDGLTEFSPPVKISDRKSIGMACQAYSKHLKGTDKGKNMSLVGIRLMASLPLDSSLASPIPPQKVRVGSGKKKKMAYWDGLGLAETTIYTNTTIRAEQTIAGPAIMEGRYNDYLIPPGAKMKITQGLNGMMEVK